MPEKLFQFLVVALLAGNAVLTILTRQENKMTSAEALEKLNKLGLSMDAMKLALANVQSGVTIIVDQNTAQTQTIAELRALIEAGGITQEIADKLNQLDTEQSDIQTAIEGLAAGLPDEPPTVPT